MSSRLFQIGASNQSASLTSSAAKVFTGTTLKTILQVAPAIGFEVVEWGISFDGQSAALPGQVELVEVDVPSTGGTAVFIPASTVATGISSTGTTSLVVTTALQGTNAAYQIGTMAFPQPSSPGAGGQEQMQVTAGGGTTSMTVVRGVNDTQPLSSIPAGTFVYALPGTGAYSDVVPLSAQPAADPLYALLTIPGTGATGFNFSSYGSPTRGRVLDQQLLPPTAPYVKQFGYERGPQINPGRYLQIRCTFQAGVNAYAYVTVSA